MASLNTPPDSDLMSLGFASLTAASTTLYTAPAGKPARMASLTLINKTGATDTTYTVEWVIAVTSTTITLAKSQALAAKARVDNVLNFDLQLGGGDVLRITTGDDSALDAVLTYFESRR